MRRTVAHLGPEGTFSHQAALAVFGADVELVACANIPAVFEAVQDGRCTDGIAPVENSTEGGVTFTLDCLLEADLKVTGEFVLPIEQCLITKAVSLDQVLRVLSHPQALAQCRQWLRTNLPHAALESTLSTTVGVRVAQDDPSVAGISGAVASGVYNVPVLVHGIQDSSHNATRFFLLGKHDTSATGDDKTSLAFSTKDERGALCAALKIFDDGGINLCRIESRPTRDRIWEYYFFTDLIGHGQDANVKQAIAKLRASGAEVRVFGSYARHAGH